MQSATRWIRSSLRAKLLVAFLLIIAVGVVTSLLITGLVAPNFFQIHMAEMMGPGGMIGSGNMIGGTQGTQGTQMASADLQAAFQVSVTQAVLVAAGVATLVAVLASLFISDRITRPVRQMAVATRRIAAGHYSERVPADGGNSDDELDQLATSFNDMASSLETTERRRVELIGDVAHELSTPISTLKGYLEGLLDGVVEPSVETWASLHDEADRLQRLVADLQELSRAEARQLSLKLEPVDLMATTSATLDRLRTDFLDEGLELDSHVPPDLPHVMADRHRIVQVLTNLLTNALRYTPTPGCVTLSISRSPNPNGHELLTQVADTGMGIAPEHLPHLFERFYRVDKSRSRAAGGSGIGLTLARALVEAMGGRIWVESPGPGKGSTFSFTLPITTLTTLSTTRKALD